MKPGNAGGGKGPWFGYACRKSEGRRETGFKPTSPDKLRKLQRKLYHKAKQEKEQ